MGDLIQRLPTDEIILTQEENTNFSLLFGENDEEDPKPQVVVQQQQMSQPQVQQVQSPQVVSSKGVIKESSQRLDTRLRNELIHFIIIFVVIFIVNTTFVKDLIKSYIPLCNNPIWSNAAQAILSTCIIWFILNFQYSKSN